MSKSFLIPEQMFYSLVGPNKINKGFIRPIETKNAITENLNSLENILNEPNLNASAKKQLHSQHLSAYMRHVKAIEDSPVNVKIAEPSKIIDPNMYIKNQEGAYLTSYEEDDDNKSIVSGIENLFSSPPSSPKNIDSPSENVVVKTHKTPKFNSPQQLKKLRERNKVRKIERINDSASEIYQHVLKKPDYYGVTSRGEILNITKKQKLAGAKPYDAKAVILKTLGHPDTYIPSGFASFQKTLLRDSATSQMISEAKSQIGGGLLFPKLNILKRKRFVPSKWKQIR